MSGALTVGLSITRAVLEYDGKRYAVSRYAEVSSYGERSTLENELRAEVVRLAIPERPSPHIFAVAFATGRVQTVMQRGRWEGRFEEVCKLVRIERNAE